MYYLVLEELINLGGGPVVGHHHEPVVVHIQDQVLPHHGQTWEIIYVTRFANKCIQMYIDEIYKKSEYHDIEVRIRTFFIW